MEECAPNSRQAIMTNMVANQVFNYSPGQPGVNGMIPTQGGDDLTLIADHFRGRDVARGTYRYTKEYQEERRTKKLSLFRFGFHFYFLYGNEVSNELFYI